MAYASWSVVFGEQPSAAKWNILGTNDAHFNTLLGTVGVRNPYCFRAYASGGTTLTDDTAVKILFATESYDYNSNFASSTYTAPVAGVYSFQAVIHYASAIATPVLVNTWIYVGGVATVTAQDYATTGNPPIYGIFGEILLAANDTVEIYHRQNSAGAEATDTGSVKTWFAGHLVHAT